jgi:hypothetical protein
MADQAGFDDEEVAGADQGLLYFKDLAQSGLKPPLSEEAQRYSRQDLVSSSPAPAKST